MSRCSSKGIINFELSRFKTSFGRLRATGEDGEVEIVWIMKEREDCEGRIREDAGRGKIEKDRKKRE